MHIHVHIIQLSKVKVQNIDIIPLLKLLSYLSVLSYTSTDLKGQNVHIIKVYLEVLSFA